MHLLLHALRQVGDLAHPPVSQPQPLQPLGCPRACATARHALRLREKHEHIEDAHARIQPALFGQIPDPCGIRAATADLIEQSYGPGIRLVDVHDHAQGRGFPGAVGAEQPVDDARRDGERKRIHRGMSRESLGDAIDDDGFSHAQQARPLDV